MKHVAIATCIASFLLLSGCEGSSSEPPGTLQVSWTLGTETCAGLGMTIADVSLIGMDGIVYDTQRVACTIQTHLFRNIPAGAYTVQIFGYRANATTPEYEGSGPPVAVEPGRTALATIPMQRRPGSINVAWSFSDGKLCGFAGVDTVQLTVGQVGTPNAQTYDYPCDPLAAQAKAEAEDPRAQLLDLDGYFINIPGLDAGEYRVIAKGMRTVQPQQATTLYAALSEVVVLYGQVLPIEMKLAPCDGTANSACF